jgi:hypothetical protein
VQKTRLNGDRGFSPALADRCPKMPEYARSKKIVSIAPIAYQAEHEEKQVDAKMTPL